MDFIPLNFRLMAQPLNWIIILLMLVIAGFAAEVAYNFAVTHHAINNTSESA